MPTSVVTFIPNPASVTVRYQSSTVFTVAANTFAYVTSTTWDDTNYIEINGNQADGHGATGVTVLNFWVPAGTTVELPSPANDVSFIAQVFNL